MSKIEFNAKVWKSGNAYVITIPKFLMENKIIDDDGKIRVRLVNNYVEA